MPAARATSNARYAARATSRELTRLPCHRRATQGNALLALIVAQPQHWQALAASVVAAQPTPEGRERASAALGSLLSTNNVANNLSRPNRMRFRANLERMLQAFSGAGLVVPSAGG